MKENVLDVLMYLFENYMDEEAINPDRDTITVELQEAGFPANEVEKAWDWLDDLLESKQQLLPQLQPIQKSVRIFTDAEKRKLNSDCQGFLIFLENVGVLDQCSRELVIDRVMALETTEIDEEQLKWVTLLVLFNQPGREAAFTWLEDLVYEEIGSLH